MKRIFTLVLSALMLGGGNAFAQEEDMTSYIVNAGFDTDLTWNADGSKKGPKVNEKELSNRSIAYETEDGSLYATVNSKTDKKRADGRTYEATNGFVGQLNGWEWVNLSDATKPNERHESKSCEWVYFGTVPYDLAADAVPIADDGTQYLTVPATTDEFDCGNGALYLRAGWGNSFAYQQVVKLPCAVYRLEYWTINVNPNTTASATDLSKITCRKDVFQEEGGSALTATEWTKHEFEFTPTSEFTIQFGFKAGNGGSGSTPWVYIDGIKLYKIDEADPMDIIWSDIYDTQEEILEFANEEPWSNYPGLCDELNDYVQEIVEDKETLTELEAALQAMTAFKSKLIALKDTLEMFESLKTEAETLRDAVVSYPGIDAFSQAIDDLGEAMLSAKADEVGKVYDDLVEAIKTYRFSQVATADNPADYTFLVKSPYFTQTAANPTIIYAADGTIESIEYPNASTYTAGSKPADGSSDGWYNAGTTEGDHRLNWVDGRVCWNAWRTNAQDVAVAQDLTDLPNGVYTVSAEMKTQADYVSNQHIYATNNLSSKVSPALTEGKWETEEWDYLTTKKIIVYNGKLTIGAIGSAKDGSTNQTGWFVVTNFRLQYYGPASADEMDDAVNDKFQEATDYAATMHLAKDKADLLGTIDYTKNPLDLDSLANFMKIASASEARYASVLEGTYKNLQDSIQNTKNSYSTMARKWAAVPVNYMTNYIGSAEATYTELDSITRILRIYHDELIPALQKAENAKFKTELAQNFINNTITNVDEKLTAYTQKDAFLREQIAALNEGVDVATRADVPVEAGTDMTAYITNATVDDNKATGWTFIKIKGDGDGAKSGQQVDGNGSGYYMDTWQASGGIRATWYQVLDVPNGTYTVSNIMRSPGTGAYLFASDKEPIETTNEVKTLDPAANNVLSLATLTPTNVTKYVNSAATSLETGGDSILNAADAYGEIWTAAADKVITAMNLDISGVTEEFNIYQLAIEANNGDETCPKAVNATDWAILSANDGKGRGWFNNSLQYEVTNHTLVIGVTCDYQFINKTEADAYTGDWFSADNFQLTLITPGDNTGWDPTTEIEETEIATAPAATGRMYNLLGQPVNKSYKGIIIKDGKAYLNN